jgi:hypothetical protein
LRESDNSINKSIETYLLKTKGTRIGDVTINSGRNPNAVSKKRKQREYELDEESSQMSIATETP